MTLATATIDSLWRHPIKGFTPEQVAETLLSEDGFFPTSSRSIGYMRSRSGHRVSTPKTQRPFPR
jgi:uncharacterized protein